MASSRRIFVYGGLGVLGSEVCEMALTRGDEVVCYDCLSTSDDGDIVNGCSLAEKRIAMKRLSEFPRFSLATRDDPLSALLEAMPTELALLGNSGRNQTASLTYDMLKAATSVRSAVVASSALVYDTSTAGARRGGRSERTHKRPLLSESDAVLNARYDDDGPAGATRRLERAAEEACRARLDLAVGLLRYFGVFGGTASGWGRRVATNYADGVSPLGVRSIGAYGSSDLCGLTDAADVTLRALDFFAHSQHRPCSAVALNVGTGRAHRIEHLRRAVAKALTSVGCSPSLAAKSDAARVGFAAADVSKLRALLGWVPSTPLDHAIAKELARAVARETYRQLPDAAALLDPEMRHLISEYLTAAPSNPTATPQRAQEDDLSSSPSRSLAALDLSSCTPTNLLQVSHSTLRNLTRARFHRVHNTEAHNSTYKHQRFFQLNQRTVMPYQDEAKSRESAARSARSLGTVFT